MSLNLDKSTRIMFALVESTATAQAELLAKLRETALAVASDKTIASEANKAAKDGTSSLWGLSRDLTESIATDARAEELNAEQVGAVLSAVVGDALAGEDAAIKTVKAYVSTCRKVVTAVKAGKVQFHQLRTKMVKNGDSFEEAEVTYDEARDMLKSSDQKAIDALYEAVVGELKTIRGRENDARPASARKADLEAILATVAGIAGTIKSEKEQQSAAAKMARGISSLRQQQPAGPMTTEVTKVAASA